MSPTDNKTYPRRQTGQTLYYRESQIVLQILPGPRQRTAETLMFIITLRKFMTGLSKYHLRDSD